MALYSLYRGVRDRGYFARWSERLGFLPASFETTGAGAIWFHSVSVGEVLSAETLLRRMRAERPGQRMYVSTSTRSGRALGDQKLAGLCDGVFFAPLDYRSAVRRVLRRLRPALVVVLETEIWPNLYRESKRAGASLLVVNGRISDRALPRYRRWSGFFRHVLCWPDAILAQSEEDRRRFIATGAPSESVKVAGNVKYDFSPPAGGIAPDIARFLETLNPAAVWIAASTMPPAGAGDVDEDDVVIAAWKELAAGRTRTLFILAPRRPERFDLAAEKLERAGVTFVRRTSLHTKLDLPATLLLDSIGELAALFERADLVFMGGTLARRGGHNILEPAYFAKPVIVGPHMENFSTMAREFHAAGALIGIDEPAALAACAGQLLDDPARRATAGGKARDLAMARRGVTERITEEIWRACGQGVPNPPRPLGARVLFGPLAWMWRAGHLVRFARGLAARRSLKTPVVSIGGLAMGGAGKSPLVAHLAARLREAGRNPAILTRGYGRQVAQETIVQRGEKAPVERTGDEAQMFIRRGDAHVGIGADRFAVGRRMEEELAPDIFLLDDGFQHSRLARRHDVVLIDALDPLAGGVFPLGRLREPLDNVARANTLVITRVERCQDTAGIERLLRRYNAEAPIFRSRVVARQWVDFGGGGARDAAIVELGRVGAFCGLGSPRSFWRTLEELGIEVAFRRVFRDHHRYRPEDLKSLADDAAAAGVGVLLTTEKDLMNLGEDAAALLAPNQLLWLKIGIEIEREAEFLQRIL